MIKSKKKHASSKRKDDADPFDSDTSLDKYCQDDDFGSSSSSTTTSKSSPIGTLEAKKMFVKKPKPVTDSLKDDIKPTLMYDRDRLKSEIDRPSNPLAKYNNHQSFVVDSPGSAVPDDHRKDETLLSTVKFGSETLEEEQEKQAFFQKFEKDKDQRDIDYGQLSKQIQLEASPTKNGIEHPVTDSFGDQIKQMSTPIHGKLNMSAVKESISNALDLEMQDEEKSNLTASNKYISTNQPVIPALASIDDLSRTTKTTSDQPSTSISTTRDLGKVKIDKKQNSSSLSIIRAPRTPSIDSNQKALPQQSKVLKQLSKSSVQTQPKKESLDVSSRPKTAPKPASSLQDNKPNELVQLLTNENKTLKADIQSQKRLYEEKISTLSKQIDDLETQIQQLKAMLVEHQKAPLIPKNCDLNDLETLINKYASENERCCKEIKQLQQQHKQQEKVLLADNEQLRQELIHTKLLLEQHQNVHTEPVKKQSSTIVLSNLANDDNDRSHLVNENQRLKNELISLQHKLTTASNKEQEIEDRSNLRSIDQRRIKDLERQVKELELINRRHHQTSTTQVGMTLNPVDKNDLEQKLQQAEQKLRERQRNEEKVTHELNLLEEKYAVLKQMLNNQNGQQTIISEQFERQVNDALTKNKSLSSQNNLRRENERIKNELEKLKNEHVPKPAKSLKRDLETIKLLRTDLERKNDELEKLRALYDAVTVQHKSLLAEREREKTRLAIMGNKPYQPDRFTQALSPVEEIHAENEQLKHLVEKLEHDSQQKHVEIMQLRNDRQTSIASALRDKDEEIQRLRQQHKLELQTVINEMSSNKNEIRINDLLKKIELQDVTIARLKKLTEHADENARELAVLRVRDDELKSTINRLEQELTDARAYHTPEMKHFQALQSKINQLEQRWQNRDKITKDYTHSIVKQNELDTNNDVAKLRAIIKQKNQEIERFHIELDSMLDLLKTLKFQQLLLNQ